MLKNIAILLVWGICSFYTAAAQNKSNRGKEFWLGYSFSSNFFPHPGLSDPVNQQELSLYISTAAQPANVTVSITGTTWTQTLAIPANTADATIIIPKAGPEDARILSDGLSGKGIRVVSDVPVAVYAHQYDAMYSAATMLMPVETWGLTYYSVNYYQTKGLSNPGFVENTGGINFPDWYNWFYIVAKDDNTRVQITPSDTCKNGWLPGQTYTVNLNKGQIYTVFGKANFAAGWFTDTVNSSKDLTGSKVLSVAGADGVCHPVALFSGTGGMHVCQRDGGEAVQQQVFPLQAWGTQYLTHHTISNFSGDINATFRNYYRVCVKDPATVVKRNGVPLTGLQRNFFYQFLDSTGGDFIEADKPILVSQYMPNRAQCWMNITPAQTAIGDPEMFYLSPIEQGQQSVVFYTSSFNLISKSYVNIIVPTPGIASLRVDGAAVAATKIKVHPNNPAYSVAIADLSGTMDMQHTITSDSAFTATVYGLGAYESYGYNIGCNINNLNIKSEIKNVFNVSGLPDTITCRKTPFRIYAKLGYRLSNIRWHFGAVPGLTPNADSIIANPVPVDSPLINGRKYFTYTVQQDLSFANTGTYKIPLSYTAPEIDACNNTETDTLVVVVRPGPVADFSATNPACLKDSVYFFGSPSGPFTLVDHKWLFGDNSTTSGINTAKKFNVVAGPPEPVKYSVYASNGCIGDTVKPVPINPSPAANFGVTTNLCAGDSTRITDSSSIANGNISGWEWYFSEGGSQVNSNNNPFFHTYTQPGSYTIKLVTVSANGCKSDTAVRTVVVRPVPNAQFTISGNICTGDSVRFTDGSTISAGTLVTWNWSFGDGQTASYTNNNSFYHTYAANGNFTARLEVVSATGCRDTFSLPLTVSSRPVVTFNYIGKPCIDSVLQFSSSYTNTSTATTRWHWNFGDGQTANINGASTASHAYLATQSGITVKHLVWLGPGCYSDTATLTIPLIYPIPTASFGISAYTICAGDAVQISGSASAGVTTWSWNFGNGTGSSAPPFSRSYPAPGNYTLRLTVGNAGGCTLSLLPLPLVVNPVPTVNAGLDKAILAGASVTLDAAIANAANYDFLWSPASGLSSATVLNPVASPAQTTTYTIAATDRSTLCAGTDVVVVRIISQLLVPSGFTPNRDGVNDRWEIPGLALYPNAKVSVYNRWGLKIYETTDYDNHPWDGSYKGVQQPGGVYAYIIQLNNAKKELLKGTVTIIR